MHELRYKGKDTIIHSLSPFAKLGWGSSLLVLSMIFYHPVYILAIFLPVIILVKAAGVSREWASMMKVTIWLGASIIAINALVSNHGAHILFAMPFQLPVLGRPLITLEAIAFGAMMALKLLVIISAFALINLTIHPDDIMSAALKMKLPYKSVLVTSLSTRFIPSLIEDVERISDVYRTRGVQLDAGNWIRKLKTRAVITIPLLSNSLDRAIQVAEAMEARAFGTGQKRVFYKDIRMSRVDWVTVAFGIVPLVTGIILRLWGYGDYQYYPHLEAIALGLSESALLGMLALLLVAILPLASLKKRIELD